MLKYRVVNNQSGEVREWEVEETEQEAKKAHRLLREIVKTDMEHFPFSRPEITVTGENEELVRKYQNKALNYLSKYLIRPNEVIEED